MHINHLVAAISLLTGSLAAQAAPSGIVNVLEQRYNNTVETCDSSGSSAAFECSGILLRGLNPSPAYNFFEPSPQSQKSGAISLSYLRRDANFLDLAYGYKSGVILDNPALNPADHDDLEVNCFFVIDGASEYRDRKGCGDSNLTTAKERFCQEQGVSTAQEWAASYQAHYSNHSSQCAFNLAKDPSANAGKAFYVGLQAMSTLTETHNTQNELRVTTWKVDPPRSPSLLAAFYIDPAGLDGARLYQRQWWQATGELLPIVNLRLPASRTGVAQFIFKQEDQLTLTAGPRTLSVAASQTAASQAAASPPPSTCTSYIQSSRWNYQLEPGFNTYVWRLEITPTPCGRQAGESQTDAFLKAIMSRHLRDSQWKDNPANPDQNVASMRRQLACHLQLHRNAPMWTLEPARRYVDHATAVSRDCNF